MVVSAYGVAFGQDYGRIDTLLSLRNGKLVDYVQSNDDTILIHIEDEPAPFRGTES